MGFETNRYLSEQVAGAGTATAPGLLPTTVLNIAHPDPSEVEIAEAVEQFAHDWHDLVDAFPARDSLREAVFAVAESAAQRLRTRTEPTVLPRQTNETHKKYDRIWSHRQSETPSGEQDIGLAQLKSVGDNAKPPKESGESQKEASQQGPQRQTANKNKTIRSAAGGPASQPSKLDAPGTSGATAYPQPAKPTEPQALLGAVRGATMAEVPPARQRTGAAKGSPAPSESRTAIGAEGTITGRAAADVGEPQETPAQQRRKTTESQGVSAWPVENAVLGKPATKVPVSVKESTRQTSALGKANVGGHASEDPALASATKTVQGMRPASPPERGRSLSGTVFSGILITFLIALVIAVIAAAKSGGKSTGVASQEIVRIDGLDWMRETAESAATFSEAQRYCLAIEPNSWNGLQPDWSRQWRLPEIHELKGIIEMQGNPPWVVGALHSSTKAQGGYWSATLAEGQSDSGIVQTVSFGGGFAGTTPGTIPQWFRCVRGEKKAPAASPTPHEAEVLPSPFAVDLSEGTVRDSRTGLVWERADSGEAVDWASAKAICKRKSRTGGPWRLPTKAEVAALIGGADGDPKLRDSFAKAFANSKYTYWNWTETAVAYGKGSRDKYKIGVAPPHWGSVEYDKVEAAYHVRCVRGELPPQTPKKNTQRRSKKSENSGGGDEKPVFLD